MRTWRSAPSASCTTPASTAPAAAQVRNSAQPSLSTVTLVWLETPEKFGRQLKAGLRGTLVINPG
jgi:hypothetical protein